MTALKDGLGFEEVVQSGAGQQNRNAFFTGSVTAAGGFDTAGSVVSTSGYVSSGDFNTTENVVLAAGSPFGKGVVIPMSARNNISGGMFVSASGNLAIAAPTSTLFPIGVAEPGTDVASGGTVQVIIHGVAAVIAEETVKVGEGCIMGAGAAQNTVLPADTSSGLRIFGVLDAAGSEGAVFITL